MLGAGKRLLDAADKLHRERSLADACNKAGEQRRAERRLELREIYGADFLTAFEMCLRLAARGAGL